MYFLVFLYIFPNSALKPPCCSRELMSRSVTQCPSLDSDVPGAGAHKGRLGLCPVAGFGIYLHFINAQSQRRRCGSTIPARLWVLRHPLMLLESSSGCRATGLQAVPRREQGICAGPEPPKTAPEMQPDENRDIHPSAGWSPQTLRSDLALGGGESLEGGISHPPHITPLPGHHQDPAALRVAQRGFAGQAAHAHLSHPLLPVRWEKQTQKRPKSPK